MQGKWIRVGSAAWDSPFSDEPATQYQDRNGVVWRTREQKRADGWYVIEARPYKPGDAYAVRADGHWPVSAVMDTSIGKDHGTDDSREFFGGSIDQFVDSKDKGKWWLWLLAIWAGSKVLGRR